MRIHQAATQWLASLDGLAPSTHSDYESVVRCHVIPLWGDIRVPKLSRDLITSALMSDVSPGRRQRVRAVLRLIFTYHGLFTDRVNVPLRAKQEARTLRVPSLEDVEALSRELGHYSDLVRFAAGSGLRWGEIVALEATDCARDVVSVTKAWCTRSSTMKSPKSEAGIRRVLVHPIGVSALQNRLEAATVPLFATEQSQRLHNANFNKRWRTARERLGMEWRFHDLRHTYATLLIEQGVNSVALCAMLGHSKPSVTYDIYAGFFSDPVDTVRAQIERGRR